MKVANIILDTNHQLIELGFEYDNIRNNNWKILRKLRYDKLLFSFKPLKLKYWLSPEEINLITGKDFIK